MLVKYIGQKQRCTVMLPIGCKSHSAWERGGSKVVSFSKGDPYPLPDADAMRLVRADKNFELVTREADVVEASGDRGGEAVTAEADVHAGLVHAEPLDGTEFAEAIEAAPVPKRRGRPKK